MSLGATTCAGEWQALVLEGTGEMKKPISFTSPKAQARRSGGRRNHRRHVMEQLVNQFFKRKP